MVYQDKFTSRGSMPIPTGGDHRVSFGHNHLMDTMRHAFPAYDEFVTFLESHMRLRPGEELPNPFYIMMLGPAVLTPDHLRLRDQDKNDGGKLPPGRSCCVMFTKSMEMAIGGIMNGFHRGDKEAHIHVARIADIKAAAPRVKVAWFPTRNKLHGEILGSGPDNELTVEERVALAGVFVDAQHCNVPEPRNYLHRVRNMLRR